MTQLTQGLNKLSELNELKRLSQRGITMKKMAKGILLVVGFIMMASSVEAQWSHSCTENTPICNWYGDQGAAGTLLSDSAGGAIVIFGHRTGPYEWEVDAYAQHIDREGYLLWGNSARLIESSPGNYHGRSIARDGILKNNDGGWYLIIRDVYFNHQTLLEDSSMVFFQRYDSLANPLWGEKGIQMTPMNSVMGDTFYGAEHMVNDGEGGIIFVRTRYIKDKEMKVWLQRMSPEGEFMWDSVGVQMLCYHDPDSFYFGFTDLVPDGQGGAVFCYENGYFQRVDRDGHKLWGENLIHPWPEAPESTVVGYMLPMRDGGVILVGSRYEGRHGGHDYSCVKAQRLDGDGNPLWGEGGVQVSPVGLELSGGGKVVSDGGGGAITVWSVADTLWGVHRSVYAQRIDSLGNLLWDEEGVLICDGAVGCPGRRRMCTDGTGGVIIAWEDRRNETNWDCDIYGQRIDSAGVVRWKENGIPISRKLRTQDCQSIVSDGSGGAIIVWTELNYETDWDVYGQQVNGKGQLGVVDWVEPGYKEVLPSQFALLQNYPNPFNATTIINYELRIKNSPVRTTLKIYNILGEEVVTLVDKKQKAGSYRVVWDGRNNQGKELVSGIYFCRLITGGFSQVRKLALIR